MVADLPYDRSGLISFQVYSYVLPHTHIAREPSLSDRANLTCKMSDRVNLTGKMH